MDFNLTRLCQGLVHGHRSDVKVDLGAVQEANESARGMPRLSEAMKDVINCDKPRGLVMQRDPWISEWGNPLR